MGIKNFFKIAVKNPDSEFNGQPLGNVGVEMSLTKLRGKKAAVDAMNMIYRAVLAMRTITALTDESGETTAHINTIFSQVLQYKNAGIEQIWVFDSSTPPEIKRAELERRKEKREQSKNTKVQFKVTSKHIEDIKKTP